MAQAGSPSDGTHSQRASLLAAIESGANIALIIAVICVFQGSSEVLYQLGLLLIVVGVLGILGAMVFKRVGLITILERSSVLGMVLGILGMLQPWNIVWYENGFYLLAIMTLGFIIILHFPTEDSA